MASFLTHNRRAVFIIWAVCMGAWVLSLAIRAFLAWRNKQVFVMLNGVLSNTRVMTEAGVARECERRHVLSVAEVVALEQRIAEDGTPLASLMEQAGKTVAHTVRAWVPDPAPVVILTGSGNNGGDGWVCAHELACAGWPVVLIAPDLAERIHTEPARSTAMDVFADATAQNLPLSVLIAPDTDVLNQTIDGAKAIVDAMLGTGFSGEVVREPYASWIRAANRRRFEGSRKGKRGAHRQRAKRQGAHARLNTWQLIPKAKDAPLALSVDAPSGLSAETGEVAQPCFMADITVTMLANKPGLATKDSATYTGVLHIEDLGVDLSRYRTS